MDNFVYQLMCNSNSEQEGLIKFKTHKIQNYDFIFHTNKLQNYISGIYEQIKTATLHGLSTIFLIPNNTYRLNYW